jgi:LmbE family N-acetylglucosaminyl deacetylase
MIQDITAKRILVFAPHPDDDILGCGGSIAWHVEQGDQVKIVYLTSGESGSLDIGKGELGLLREREARAAAQVLGVKETEFLRWPDGYLAVRPEYLRQLTSLIRAERPHRVYLPHSQDAVYDHLIIHQLVMEAMRRASGPWFQECPGEPWSVGTALGYEIWTPILSPGLSLDISAFMGKKIAALNEHRSQLEGLRYDEAITGLNRYRAVMNSRYEYCECFQLIKTHKVMDKPAYE